MSKLVFFFDWNISPRLAEMTKIYEDPRHIIQHHDTRFHEKTPAVEWLAALGSDKPKPIVISGDAAILKNQSGTQRTEKREPRLLLPAARVDGALVPRTGLNVLQSVADDRLQRRRVPSATL